VLGLAPPRPSLRGRQVLAGGGGGSGGLRAATPPEPGRALSGAGDAPGWAKRSWDGLCPGQGPAAAWGGGRGGAAGGRAGDGAEPGAQPATAEGPWVPREGSPLPCLLVGHSRGWVG